VSLLATAQVISADGEFHAPSITDFFPPAVLFENSAFELNRIMLIRLLVTVLLLALFVGTAARARLVPGRLQGAVEMILDFARINIAQEVLGEKLGKKYTPIITTIFCAILFFNLTGVIPGLNIAGTGVIGLPLMFALWVWISYHVAGIKQHGFGGYLKVSLFPPGVPWPLYVLLTPIELMQKLILQPATLTIRLLANMIAGHLLLALCFAGTQFLFFSASGGLKALGVVTFTGGFAFFLLEIFVAALQAYVFAILTATYLNMAVADEH